MWKWPNVQLVSIVAENPSTLFPIPLHMVLTPFLHLQKNLFQTIQPYAWFVTEKQRLSLIEPWLDKFSSQL